MGRVHARLQLVEGGHQVLRQHRVGQLGGAQFGHGFVAHFGRALSQGLQRLMRLGGRGGPRHLLELALGRVHARQREHQVVFALGTNPTQVRLLAGVDPPRGNEAVAFEVVKQSGKNTIEVADAVMARLREMDTVLNEARGLALSVNETRGALEALYSGDYRGTNVAARAQLVAQRWAARRHSPGATTQPSRTSSSV